MERLTTDNPRNNTEMALNLVYVKDGQAWVRNGGPCPGYPDVTLYDYMRLIIADHGPMSIKTGLTDDELGDALDDALFDGIETKEGLLPCCIHWRGPLRNSGNASPPTRPTMLTPAQIKYILPKQSAEEVVERMRDEKERYDEWFAWKQAESDGRLVVLPCKVGDVVYQRDSYGNLYEATVQSIVIDNRRMIFITSGIGFDCDAIGKSVFLTREEAEKALEGMGNDCD